jgi:hypothetical protein
MDYFHGQMHWVQFKVIKVAKETANRIWELQDLRVF